MAHGHASGSNTITAAGPSSTPHGHVRLQPINLKRPRPPCLLMRFLWFLVWFFFSSPIQFIYLRGRCLFPPISVPFPFPTASITRRFRSRRPVSKQVETNLLIVRLSLYLPACICMVGPMINMQSTMSEQVKTTPGIPPKEP
jgi:hypothetical protein